MRNQVVDDESISMLRDIETRIERTRRGPLTLDPERDRATPLSKIVESLGTAEQRAVLARAADAIARAQIDSFPDNLFWDFDYLLSSIHENALCDEDYESAVELARELAVELMMLYGRRSAIRFRYVHDFIYGFDWARWVRRAAPDRAGVQPFASEFMTQSLRRGRALLEMIEADDERYPKLRNGQVRNPFRFSREPEGELRLYRDLAKHGSLPLQAWSQDATPSWDRDFDALREQRAEALGLRK